MEFTGLNYGTDVAHILGMLGDGKRAMPLASAKCASEAARGELRKRKDRELFPGAVSPEGAMAGLYLYFSCLDEAHTLAQELSTAEGSFWHGIMHRQEPDAANAGYWFRQTGKHAIFPALRDEARGLGFDAGAEWDPFLFIEFCETARARPGSDEERLAMQVQLAEWQLLFDFCAGAGK